MILSKNNEPKYAKATIENSPKLQIRIAYAVEQTASTPTEQTDLVPSRIVINNEKQFAEIRKESTGSEDRNSEGAKQSQKKQSLLKPLLLLVAATSYLCFNNTDIVRSHEQIQLGFQINKDIDELQHTQPGNLKLRRSLRLATDYYGMGDFDSALKYYCATHAAASKLPPESIERGTTQQAELGIAKCLFRLHRYSEAWIRFDAINVNHHAIKDPEALRMLGYRSWIYPINDRDIDKFPSPN